MPKKTKEQDNTIENLKNYLLSPIKINKDKKTKTSKKKVTKHEAKKETAPKAKVATKKTQNTLSASKVTVKDKNKTSNLTKAKKETKKVKTFLPEYYDLPYKYNKTVVKILAQTPSNLFVYWEISDEDRTKLKETYGNYFFEITKPVLVVHNITKNYSFELDINDFANSWYFHVDDSNCEYQIELGRRPIPVNYSYMPNYDTKKSGPIAPIETPYVYISSSNNLEAPNDHILFNNSNKIYFKNVKTNQIIEKDIKDFPFIAKDNEFVNVYEIYKKLYKDEISNDHFDRMNPSSGGNPSSGNLSSW